MADEPKAADQVVKDAKARAHRELLRQAQDRGANPPAGTRGDFVVKQISVSPELYRVVSAFSTDRQARGERNHCFAEIVREALMSWSEDQVARAAGDDD